MSYVFLSYAREDEQRAAMLARALESLGWKVWWDRQIPAGRRFDDVIEAAIDAAACVVVIWSAHSVKSDWVKTEAAEGAERAVLVPVRIDEAKVPLAFKRLHTVALVGWAGDVSDDGFQRLASDIRSFIAPARREKQEPGAPSAPAELSEIAELDQVVKRPLETSDAKVRAANLIEAGNIAHQRFGDSRKAAGFYREALKHDPRSIPAITLLATLLAEHGERDEAFDIVKATASRYESPGSRVRAYKAFGAVFQSRDLMLSVQSYQAALAERPDDIDCLTQLAGIYADAQNWDSAINVLLRLASVQGGGPAAVPTFLELASIYESIGMIEETRAAFKKVLELDPSNKKAKAALATLTR